MGTWCCLGVFFIPKVDEPFALKDYRPISLLGRLYKLISKVLAAHLAIVLNSFISMSQTIGREKISQQI